MPILQTIHSILKKHDNLILLCNIDPLISNLFHYNATVTDLYRLCRSVPFLKLSRCAI